jgi:hypothetical protein
LLILKVGLIYLRKEEVEVTDLQIKYQSLLLDRQRVQEELALNKRQLSEVERHNLAVEENAREQIRIGWHEAESTRMNAETNRLNYSVNAYNAETNRMNAQTNRYNADTNRLNYQVNKQNAQTNWYNAQTQRGYLQLQQELQPYTIELTKAQTESQRANVRDIDAKIASGYWATHSAKNVTSALADLGRTVDDVASLFRGAGSSTFAGIARNSKPVTSPDYGPTSAGSWDPSASSAARKVAQQSKYRNSELGSEWSAQLYSLYRFVTRKDAPWDRMNANTRAEKEEIGVLNSLRQLGQLGEKGWNDFVDLAADTYDTIWRGLAPFSIPYWVDRASSGRHY